MTKKLQLPPYTIVDLSQTLGSDSPSWNGKCGFRSKILMDYPKGCRVMHFDMIAGMGTHIDAPNHFVENGQDITEMAVSNFVAPLCVLHMQEIDDPDYFISVQDLKRFEKQHGEIPKGALVVANFGWSKRWRDVQSYRNEMHFPGFHAEAADFLVQRKIHGIGIDTLSPDGSNMKFPVHHLLLPKGIYIIENLILPDDLPPQGALGVALPAKIQGGSEAIARVIALCPV